MKRKAFTLIELLVVISIIALLMAIMMPALSMVKDKARAVVCQTNLKQYGIAGTMYTTENDGKFPQPGYWLFSYNTLATSSAPNECRWHDPEMVADGTLWPYLKNEDVHLCPKFSSLAKSWGPSHPNHNSSIPVEPRYSYTMNGHLGTSAVWGAGEGSGVLKASEVRRPSRVLFFTEEGLEPVDGYSRYALNDQIMLPRYGSLTPGDYCDSLGGYHDAKGGDLMSGYANIVFVDGHVGKGTPEQSFELAYPFPLTESMR